MRRKFTQRKTILQEVGKRPFSKDYSPHFIVLNLYRLLTLVLSSRHSEKDSPVFN